MAFSLFELLANWESIGFFSIALPFLLIFTLAFATLQKTQILGTGSKNFNAIVSFIIGALAVRSPDVILLIQRFLPNVSMFIVIALMLLLLIGIFAGGSFTGFTGGSLLVVAIISFIFVGWALTADSLFAPYWLQDLFFLQDIGSLTLIGGFALAIWLVTHTPGRTRAPISEWLNWFTGGRGGGNP